MFTPGSREMVGESRRKGTALVLATLRRGVRVWVVYLTPKIERIIVLLSASPEGEARLPMPKGMAYKE
jgi:hypothetical protein